MRTSQTHRQRTGRWRLWLFGLAAMTLAVGCGPAAARERPATTPAARFLQDKIDRALILARPPVSAKDSGDLDILIRDAMDWPGLSSFAIGRYRVSLDEGGLSDASARLERQLGLLARRAAKDMPSLAIVLRGMRIDAEGNRYILSTASVPRFGAIEMQWALRPTASGYRVADIAAMGLTLRQFLRGWVAGLIAAQCGDPEAVFNDAASASPQ
jgi:hypothetical protein